MLKAVVNQTVIRPVLMYGSETWALRKAEQNLLIKGSTTICLCRKTLDIISTTNFAACVRCVLKI